MLCCTLNALLCRETGIEDVETRHLPLVIREGDVEYQFHRLVLYHRLLRVG